MISKEEDFLLGTNVNEPVGIEIPVQISDVYGLYDFLETVGFNLTKDGKELNKILIDTKPTYATFGYEKTYSIITPALKPEDRKQFYESLKHALDEYKKRLSHDEQINMKVFYPHILDLKNLITNTTNIEKNNELAEDVIKILSDLEKSKDVFLLRRDAKTQEHQLRTIFPNGALLNGSAISDPYSVATNDICRYTRYATIDCSYAITFSGIFGKKDSNAYTNMSPDGRNKIGFVFQYMSLPRRQQLYFRNAHIESRGSGFEKHDIYSFGNTLDDAETAINRFDNPCIGIYLVWQNVNSPNFYFMYKFEENDPRYQILKKYYIPCNSCSLSSRHDRLMTWNQKKGDNETYVSLQDGIQDEIKSNVDNIIHKYEQLKQRFEYIFEEEDDTARLSYSHDDKIDDIFKENIFLSSLQEKSNETKSYLQDLQKQLNEIKVEIDNDKILKNFYYGNFQQLYERLQYKIERCDKVLKTTEIVKQENISNMENRVISFAKGEKTVDLQFCEKVLDSVKINVLNYIRDDYTGSNYPANTLAIIMASMYTYADVSQKQKLFKTLYAIRQQIPKKLLKKMRNQIKNTITYKQDLKVLSELFKNDNLFVKHTERAKKLIELKMGKFKIQELNNKTLSNSQTVSKRIF